MFKVGDMVKVVGYPKRVDMMKELLGKTLEIQAIRKDILGRTWYMAEGW